MLKRFVAEYEEQPEVAWLGRFSAGRDEAVRWYLGNGLASPPTARECRAALSEHMPELVPHYDRACALVGDDDLAYRIISHYRSPPVRHGCSQAVWLGGGRPALIRNYDFPLEMVSGRFEATAWDGHRVIATVQRPWGGCLDGMNEDGLAVSLTSGGGSARGSGFAVILILRYVLETCRSVDEAVTALSRIPIALNHNVTLLDRTGTYATVFLGPTRMPSVSRLLACTNHQESFDTGPSPRPAGSIMRHRTLSARLDDPTMTLETLTARFFEAPLYSRRIGFPTVYTAVYRPRDGQVDCLWPGKRWTQRFDRFRTGEYTHDYGDLTA